MIDRQSCRSAVIRSAISAVAVWPNFGASGCAWHGKQLGRRLFLHRPSRSLVLELLTSLAFHH